jgi:hypothetical protein
MEFLGYLAPVAFVFALQATSGLGALRKEIKELKEEIEKLKAEKASS